MDKDRYVPVVIKSTLNFLERIVFLNVSDADPAESRSDSWRLLLQNFRHKKLRKS